MTEALKHIVANNTNALTKHVITCISLALWLQNGTQIHIFNDVLFSVLGWVLFWSYIVSDESLVISVNIITMSDHVTLSYEDPCNNFDSTLHLFYKMFSNLGPYIPVNKISLQLTHFVWYSSYYGHYVILVHHKSHFQLL